MCVEDHFVHVTQYTVGHLIADAWNMSGAIILLVSLTNSNSASKYARLYPQFQALPGYMHIEGGGRRSNFDSNDILQGDW